jgi:plastocyanin
MSPLATTSTRQRLLPLLALPTLLVALIGVSGRQDDGPDTGVTGGTEVAIAGFVFEPGDLEVAAGTAVTWTNEDAAPHSVEHGVSTIPASADLAQGETFEVTYADPGEYDYICGIHASMRGTVTVT